MTKISNIIYAALLFAAYLAYIDVELYGEFLLLMISVTSGFMLGKILGDGHA